MRTTLSQLLLRPQTWLGIAILLGVADSLLPAQYDICVVALVLLPVIWRTLHRRHVPLVTGALLAAVTFAPALGWLLGNVVSHSEGIPIEGISVARVLTIAGLLIGAGFHSNLQRVRRRRLALRQELQRRVRNRTTQLRRANLALLNEVAKREATEHQLDRSESSFAALTEKVQLQVARKDADGVFRFANRLFCQSLGLQPSEVIGKTDADLFSPELAAAYRNDDLRIMASGEAIEQVEEHPEAHGATGYAQVFKAPEYDQDGVCVGVQIVFWDITQKHRAEIALRDSAARKRALFESVGDAVLLVNGGGQIIEANSAAATLFSLDFSLLPGQSIAELASFDVTLNELPRAPTEAVELEDDSAPPPVSWDLLERATRHSLLLTRQNGSQFEGEVTVHEIPVGDSQGLAIIVRDVTIEHRALEALHRAKAAAEAANRTKTEFMAGVSHELRTPLGGIIGLAELIHEQELPSRDRQYVELIRQNARLLCDLIEDILDFAAIEAGRVQIDAVPCDIHAVVGDAFHALAARLGDKPIRMVLAIDSATPRHVIADPRRIREIVINIAGNALKFTSRGEVCLRLSEETSGVQDAAPFTRLLLRIADTGIGVPADKLESIFDAFECGEIGTARAYGGTGLGLSISRGLCRRMGGDIELQSTPGVGSTFLCRVQLPLASPPLGDAQLGGPGESATSHYTSAYVVTGSSSMDRAIADVLATLGISVHMDGESSAASSVQTPNERAGMLFVIAADCSQAHQVVPLRPRDRVVWITRLGKEPPKSAHPSDAQLIEPVLPDSLRAVVEDRDRSRLPRKSQPAFNPLSDAGADDSSRSKTMGSDVAATNGPLDRSGMITGKRLLLVDDSDVNRVVICDLLQREGFDVDVASNGRQALQLIAAAIGNKTDDLQFASSSTHQRGYDCILMDLQMPDIDGMETTRRIRRLFAETNQSCPPVVALTAHVTDEHRRQCQEAGMDGFLTKPIAPALLLREVQGHLRETDDRGAREHHSAAADESKVDPDIQALKALPVRAPIMNPNSQPATPEGPDPTNKAWIEKLMSHGGHDAEIVASICDAFLAEVPSLVSQIRSNQAKADVAALRTAAHTLKSCFRYVADEDDIALAADLEADAEQPESITAARIDEVERIANKWTKLVGQLRNELLQK